LIVDLVEHGAVAVDDPAGDLLVAVPSGVLDEQFVRFPVINSAAVTTTSSYGRSTSIRLAPLAMIPSRAAWLAPRGV
jgi:hypothetical protein